MDFSSSASLDAGKREQVMDHLKAQMAVTQAQELLQVGGRQCQPLKHLEKENNDQQIYLPLSQEICDW